MAMADRLCLRFAPRLLGTTVLAATLAGAGAPASTLIYFRLPKRAKQNRTSAPRVRRYDAAADACLRRVRSCCPTSRPAWAQQKRRRGPSRNKPSRRKHHQRQILRPQPARNNQYCTANTCGMACRRKPALWWKTHRRRSNVKSRSWPRASQVLTWKPLLAWIPSVGAGINDTTTSWIPAKKTFAAGCLVPHGGRSPRPAWAWMEPTW